MTTVRDIEDCVCLVRIREKKMKKRKQSCAEPTKFEFQVLAPNKKMIQWHVTNWTEWPSFLLFVLLCKYTLEQTLTMSIWLIYLSFLLFPLARFCRPLKIDVKQWQLYGFGQLWIKWQSFFLHWLREWLFCVNIIHNRPYNPRFRSHSPANINYALSQNLHKIFI